MQGQQAAAQGGALPFVVLNGAFARDVACISIPAGVTVQQPLHIVYLSTGMHLRSAHVFVRPGEVCVLSLFVQLILLCRDTHLVSYSMQVKTNA